MIRVLIVDDSPTMRAVLQRALRPAADIAVVGAVASAAEAGEMLDWCAVDLLLLDVALPGMSGLAFLERLMGDRPMPVIMISAFTRSGARQAVEALALGAIDCLGKPRNAAKDPSFGDLAERVRTAARVRPRPARERVDPARMEAAPAVTSSRIVAIGASTGGVEALGTLLAAFPKHCPPTVVALHLPAPFTASLAARLDRHAAPRVREAAEGMVLAPGEVLLAPGGLRHLTIAVGEEPRCVLRPGAPVSGHRPSVDMLFRSLAPRGADVVGLLMTGMGSDGAAGLQAIRAAGGRTLAQDAASSVVYGMARAAMARGAVERERPLADLAPTLLRLAAAPGG
ncbi:MAG: chemotaxis-specific protein-glutamate methyltransferase CheB [Pseudomonadota bacterium]